MPGGPPRGGTRWTIRSEAELGREFLPSFVARDEAVAQHDHAPGVRRDVGLVGHHDDRLPLSRQLLEDFHDLLGRRRVEVARRLVGEENRRPVHQRAGDGDALALATREFVGAMRRAIAELDAFERFHRALLPLGGTRAGVHQRELDIVQCRRARQEVERLEDEPDLLVPDARELVVLHRGRELAVEPVLAFVRRVEAADEVHERRLSRAGRPHDRHVFVAANREVNSAQRPHDLAAHVILALETARDDHPVFRGRGAGRVHDGLPLGSRGERNFLAR